MNPQNNMLILKNLNADKACLRYENLRLILQSEPAYMKFLSNNSILAEIYYQLGEMLEQEGKYSLAVKKYLKADARAADAKVIYQPVKEKLENVYLTAKRGNAEAQFCLGDMYNKGMSVIQNHSKAKKWFDRAAEQKHAGAQYMLGQMYEKGKGIGGRADYNEAMKWYLSAAKNEFPAAQCELGYIYYDGRLGVVQNFCEARKWFSLAAENKAEYKYKPVYKAKAQYMLGQMYEKGTGVIANYDEAIRWYRLAAENKSPDARYSLGHLYYTGRGVKQDFYEANEWVYLAANEGNHAGAQYRLALMYHYGKGVRQDFYEAWVWFKCAARQGYVRAQCAVGLIYIDKGVKKLNATYCGKAMMWYRRAAEQKSVNAIDLLTQLCERSDLLISVDIAIEARRAYSMAAAYSQDKRVTNSKLVLNLKRALIPVLNRCAQELPVKDGLYHLVMATGDVKKMIPKHQEIFVECLLEDTLLTDEQRFDHLKKIHKNFCFNNSSSLKRHLNQPTSNRVCYELAKRYYETIPLSDETLAQARQLYERVLKENDDYADAQADLAHIYHFLGREDKSRKCMQTAKENGNKEFIFTTDAAQAGFFKNKRINCEQDTQQNKKRKPIHYRRCP